MVCVCVFVCTYFISGLASGVFRVSFARAVSVIFHGQMRFVLFVCFFMVRCDLRCLSVSRWCCDSSKLQEMRLWHLEMLPPLSLGEAKSN